MDIVGDSNKRFNRMQSLTRKRLSRGPQSATRAGERQDPAERFQKRLAKISQGHEHAR